MTKDAQEGKKKGGYPKFSTDTQCDAYELGSNKNPRKPNALTLQC